MKASAGSLIPGRGWILNHLDQMPKFYTVKILRQCVCNRASREVGEIVEMVPASEKNALVYSRKGEVVDEVDAAALVNEAREKAVAKKAPAKKAAKKAPAKKAARKD